MAWTFLKYFAQSRLLQKTHRSFHIRTDYLCFSVGNKMQWVKQKTFRAQFISCVKPKISSDMFLAHMEDTYGGRALLKA